MRIGILGCGSLGGVIAGKLWNAQKDTVIVFELNPDIVSSVKEHGLRITENKKTTVARPEVLEGPDQLDEPMDLIILTTKATSLTRAVEAYLPFLSKQGCFMTVQNGLEALTLIDRYGEDRITAGSVMWGSSMPQPGSYTVTADGPFVVGGIDGRITEQSSLCKRALEQAFPVKLSDDMRDILWTKLTVTASLTSLGAITGLSFGEMLKSRKIRDLILAVSDEVVAVGRASGIGFLHSEGALNVNLLTGDGFPPKMFRHLLVRAIGLKHSRTESSMLASLKIAVKTEIDMVNGVVVELGKKHGIKTPVNSAIVNIVKKLETGALSPGTSAFDSLLSRLSSQMK